MIAAILSYCSFPKNVFFAQQGITLTGYGAPYFSLYESAIRLIDRKFQRKVKDGFYEPFRPTYAESYLTLEATNRYFTKKTRPKVSDEGVPLKVPTVVDPKGHLQEAAQKNMMVHLDDNTVKYFIKEDSLIDNERWA